MKKIIAILIILIALLLANTLINQDSVNKNEEPFLNLAQVINIDTFSGNMFHNALISSGENEIHLEYTTNILETLINKNINI